MRSHDCRRCGGRIPNDVVPGAYPGPMSRVDPTVELCSACGWDEVMLLRDGAHLPQPAEWPVAITHPLPRRFGHDPDPTLLARIGTRGDGPREVAIHRRSTLEDGATYQTVTDGLGTVIAVHVAEDHLDHLIATTRRAGYDPASAIRHALDEVITDAAARAGLGRDQSRSSGSSSSASLIMIPSRGHVT